MPTNLQEEERNKSSRLGHQWDQKCRARHSSLRAETASWKRQKKKQKKQKSFFANVFLSFFNIAFFINFFWSEISKCFLILAPRFSQHHGTGLREPGLLVLNRSNSVFWETISWWTAGCSRLLEPCHHSPTEGNKHHSRHKTSPKMIKLSTRQNTTC